MGTQETIGFNLFGETIGSGDDLTGESANYLINDPMIRMIQESLVIETFVLEDLFDI